MSLTNERRTPTTAKHQRVVAESPERHHPPSPLSLSMVDPRIPGYTSPLLRWQAGFFPTFSLRNRPPPCRPPRDTHLHIGDGPVFPRHLSQECRSSPTNMGGIPTVVAVMDRGRVSCRQNCRAGPSCFVDHRVRFRLGGLPAFLVGHHVAHGLIVGDLFPRFGVDVPVAARFSPPLSFRRRRSPCRPTSLPPSAS